MDKISNLYSAGEYLDNLISDVSKITLQDEVERGKKILEAQVAQLEQHQNSTYMGGQQNLPNQINIPPGLIPVWKGRLNEISSKIDPIYHTTIVEKLKKIAKVK